MAKTGQHRSGGSEGILYYDPACEVSSKISIWINRLANDFFPAGQRDGCLLVIQPLPIMRSTAFARQSITLNDYFPVRNLPVIFSWYASSETCSDSPGDPFPCDRRRSSGSGAPARPSAERTTNTCGRLPGIMGRAYQGHSDR